MLRNQTLLYPHLQGVADINLASGELAVREASAHNVRRIHVGDVSIDR